MRRLVLVEGLLLFAISCVGIAEGLRLITHRDPHALYDVLGPGYYVLMFSIALMTTGVAYLCVNYRKVLSTEKLPVKKEMRTRMISMIVVYAIYIFTINIVGYLVATLIFFFLEFRIVGIKSWIFNAILTLVATGLYYVIFIQYCNVALPRGTLLG